MLALDNRICHDCGEDRNRQDSRGDSMKPAICNLTVYLTLAVALPVFAGVVTGPADPDSTRCTNPTGRVILPLKHQSGPQQQADQAACYNWACEQLDWDPYDAYAELAAQGYTVALSRREMLKGLVFLAQDGARIGAVAGELAGDPETGVDDGTEIGVAVAVATSLIRSAYLQRPDDPAAQKAVNRYERSLRHWDHKYAACLKRKGYRVPAP